MKKTFKIKLKTISSGLFLITTLTIIPFSVISCSSKNSTNTYQNSINEWKNKFNQAYDNNFSSLVRTDLDYSIKNYELMWTNFINEYYHFYKKHFVKIPLNNANFYIYNYQISANNLEILKNQKNENCFNWDLKWNLSIGYQEKNQSISKLNLIITDHLVNATLKPTIVLSWNNLLKQKTTAYGGYYINYAKNSIIKISFPNNELINSKYNKISKLINTINDLSSLIDENTKYQNPSSKNWIAIVQMFPLVKNMINYANLLFNNYKNYKNNKTYQQFKFLESIINFNIIGIDYYDNNNQTTNFKNFLNPDFNLINKTIKDLNNKLKNEDSNLFFDKNK